MSGEINKKIVFATKWSAFAEISAKLVMPIVSIILARLLTPDAFGVVATLTMIITFAEIFTDAGFQKYIIQHDFKDEQDFDESTNVAFWSNLTVSFVLWGIIILFADSLATLVGNPGYGGVLIVACISIPLAAFSSIQFAVYKRQLDFKTLFKVRIISLSIPILVTIPLAIRFHSYWALVIGTIVQNLANAVCLTVFSSWKPRMYYSFDKLKEMISFTIWSMIAAVSIGGTAYFDVFVVGRVLSSYYLGLYKTSSTIVGQIMGLVTAITTPVLFSALSKLQTDKEEFKKLFFSFQKYVALLVIPMGVGIYCYSDLVTRLLLGEQWLETSGFIGLWGLTSSVTIVLSHYSSEVYRAQGKPKLSVLAQVLHLIVLIPAVYIAVQYSYKTLYITRSLVRFEGIIVDLIIMYTMIHISPWQMLKNIAPCCLATLIMAGGAYLLIHVSPNIAYQLGTIIICIGIYVGVICLFPKERTIVLDIANKYFKHKKTNRSNLRRCQ